MVNLTDDLGLPDETLQRINNSGYEPTDCEVPSGHKVAIIIPYRDDGSNSEYEIHTMNCVIQCIICVLQYDTLKKTIAHSCFIYFYVFQHIFSSSGPIKDNASSYDSYPNATKHKIQILHYHAKSKCYF